MNKYYAFIARGSKNKIHTKKAQKSVSVFNLRKIMEVFKKDKQHVGAPILSKAIRCDFSVSMTLAESNLHNASQVAERASIIKKHVGVPTEFMQR